MFSSRSAGMRAGHGELECYSAAGHGPNEIEDN